MVAVRLFFFFILFCRHSGRAQELRLKTFNVLFCFQQGALNCFSSFGDRRAGTCEVSFEMGAINPVKIFKGRVALSWEQ